MPICITCTTPAPYLYTTYESAHNLRLEECGNCKAFVDPYVEFDHLTLFIDLILLKRGVFRHLLYNRGAEPRRVDQGEPKKRRNIARERELKRRILLLKLGGGLTLLDAYIRWCHLNPIPSSEPIIWTAPLVKQFFSILAATIIETLSFQCAILLLVFIVLDVLSKYRNWRGTPSHTHQQQQFSFPLIPLSLFYSSLTKFFLLFLLTIWTPSSSSGDTNTQTSGTSWPESLFPHNKAVRDALHLLDDDKLDKEWLVRNVVGGMSAGFGLRVVLDDVPPVFTTLIIFMGWAAKMFVSGRVAEWIGDKAIRRAWSTYSIP
ncbi:Arv1-like family-domain-containing protein [Coprinopsis sp. MPI-PUGE-AT-0042]|nr:Arv1-like family-domain-containing protein [Coprinopsis sp. MPI-PUGE-AT-0042]